MSINLRILAVLSKAYQPGQVFKREVSGSRILFVTCAAGYPCVAMIGIREFNKQIEGNLFKRGHRTDSSGCRTVIWINMDFMSFQVKTMDGDLERLASVYN
jgi:hypothetical protein